MLSVWNLGVAKRITRGYPYPILAKLVVPIPARDIPGLPDTRVGYPAPDIAGTRTLPEILIKKLKTIITVNAL